jgi:hypothetical protein
MTDDFSDLSDQCLVCAEDSTLGCGRPYAALNARRECHVPADIAAQEKIAGVRLEEYMDYYMMYYRMEYTRIYDLLFQKFLDEHRGRLLRKYMMDTTLDPEKSFCSFCREAWSWRT